MSFSLVLSRCLVAPKTAPSDCAWLIDLAPHLPDLNLDDVDVFVSEYEVEILNDLEQSDLDLANACLELERERGASS